MSGATTSGHPDASKIVAQSLATVGYAMFTLCRTEPLNEIRPFGEVIADRNEHDPAPATLVGTPAVEASAFGEAEVDDTMAAVTPPASAPQHTVVPPAAAPTSAGAATSAMVRSGPDGQPLAGPATETEQPATPAAPRPAVLPEAPSSGSHTLAMLQEISFLDE